MKVYKKQLELFFNVLKGTEGELSLKESRIRDSFIKPLAEKTDEFIKDRVKIYETFAIKNEDGSVDFLVGEDEKGNKTQSFQFPPDKLEEINKELVVLTDEEVEFSIPDGLKDIMEKTTYSPKLGEVEVIDEILAKF